MFGGVKIIRLNAERRSPAVLSLSNYPLVGMDCKLGGLKTSFETKIFSGTVIRLLGLNNPVLCLVLFQDRGIPGIESQETWLVENHLKSNTSHHSVNGRELFP